MIDELQGIIPQKLFKNFHGSSLLSLIQPFIAKTCYEITLNNPNLSYQEISYLYLKYFVENAPLSAGFLDSNLKFISLSSKLFNQITNYYPEASSALEIESASFFEIFTQCPNKIKKALKDNLLGQEVSHNNLKYEINEGDIRWVKWRSVPWYGIDSKPLGVIFTLKDNTQPYNTQITNKKLKQANEILENFSMIFSHDIIQPMRQIANFASLMKDHIERQNYQDEFLDFSLEAINSSLRQMQIISEGITLYSKEGKLTSNKEAVYLNQVLNQIHGSCFENNNIKFHSNISEDVILYMNAASATQLFQNLLINAVKHANANHTVIILTAEKGNDEQEFIKFKLYNHGNEIDKELSKKVFAPFVSSQKDGAGIGLMICKKIIDAYKGKIYIQPVTNRGTVVTFTLPKYDEKKIKLEKAS
ncbi:PAS domain-containing sensor histidine kinase [Rickettsiales endosymbiont of Stachyamoeba lipophora]|uniref:PAS domain-containing sensor histidine kinase n=1 Tax=Rickettsiales endosymbiont of Stachyamoeba lipophora TaxID=2486578 RepID=UPI000F655F0F|nr:HAMP domain-containing sensor histidine kinase [Rickettsiales endosymbiont of Stachyamoeba lipophora]AZL16256.1 sensor histidine kinase [Rickettsiales endosymbiont of Stachyamoeba lipophora]